MTVGYFADDPASGERERVLVRLWRDDATHEVSISEAAPGSPDLDDDYEQWTTLERDGHRFELTAREHGPTTIRFEREGTSIALTSDLDREKLFTLALTLERV